LALQVFSGFESSKFFPAKLENLCRAAAALEGGKQATEPVSGQSGGPAAARQALLLMRHAPA
jgi:hypothetical protein